MRKPLHVGDVVLIKTLGKARGVVQEVILTRCFFRGKNCEILTYLVKSEGSLKFYRRRDLEVCCERNER